jgi:hypothetical protein
MQAEICPAFPSRGDHVLADIHRDCFFINVPPLSLDIPVGPRESHASLSFKVEFPDGPPGFPPRSLPAQPGPWLRAEGISAELALDIQVLASIERLTAFASDGLGASLQETVRGLTSGLHLPAAVKLHF